MSEYKYYDPIIKQVMVVNKDGNKALFYAQMFEALERYRPNYFISRETRKYITRGPSRILEGGCGIGRNVKTLWQDYYVIGIDKNQRIINRAREKYPRIKDQFLVEDVRQTLFGRNYFDGYWSLGVIEHYYSGYLSIIKEAHRILKPGGYFFVTFPQMSLLRKLKARVGLYNNINFDDINYSSDFYQYYLDHKIFLDFMNQQGFKLISYKPLDGVKGLKDEISIIEWPLKKIYNSRSFSIKVIKKALDIMLRPITGHLRYCVFRKRCNENDNNI